MERRDYENARMEQVQWLCETMAGLLHTLRERGIVTNDQIDIATKSLNSRRQGIPEDAQIIFNWIEDRLKLQQGL